MNNVQTSPTNRSPSTRGRPRSSPTTPRTIANIKPAPLKDSPEFKKPGIPVQSENRQLADAIALGRQEVCIWCDWTYCIVFGVTSRIVISLPSECALILIINLMWCDVISYYCDASKQYEKQFIAKTVHFMTKLFWWTQSLLVEEYYFKIP